MKEKKRDARFFLVFLMYHHQNLLPDEIWNNLGSQKWFNQLSNRLNGNTPHFAYLNEDGYWLFVSENPWLLEALDANSLTLKQLLSMEPARSIGGQVSQTKRFSWACAFYCWLKTAEQRGDLAVTGVRSVADELDVIESSLSWATVLPAFGEASLARAASLLQLPVKSVASWVSANIYSMPRGSLTVSSWRNLIEVFLPLVRNVAGRLAMGFPKTVELPDLVNTGVIGLTEAFRRFDPGRRIKFETFAVPRIRGAILDELRQLDWVPRSTRAKSRSLDSATHELSALLGRKPSQREIAHSMHIPLDEFSSMLEDVSNATILSLDEMVFREEDNRQIPRIETVEDCSDSSVLNGLLDHETRSELTRFVSTGLSDQERQVTALYYYEDLTLKEIGEIMQISESRASQIHTKAVMKLRQHLREVFD